MDDAEKRTIQLQREENTVGDAVAKLKKQIEVDPGNTPVGRDFLRKTWQKFAVAVETEQKRLLTIHRPRWATLMLGLDAYKLAFITIRCILEGLNAKKTEEDPEVGTYGGVAKNIGLHCRLEWFRTPAVERKRAIYDCGGENKSEDAARQARLRAGKILNGDWRDSDGDIHLGDHLIETAASLKLVVMPRKRDKDGKASGQIPVELTEEVRPSLEWREDLAELATPFYLPMICKPNEWMTLEGGGYLRNEGNREVHLVKHSDNPKILEGLPKGDYAVTKAAVNALQETRWRVNQKIYAAMRQAESMGHRGIPKKLRNMLSIKLSACAKSAKEKYFYFPYQLDFRGRAYCLPPLVNPQGDDIGRSLLEFADGKPLGQDGVRWLKIHLANSFGATKGAMDERLKWVDDHSDKIRKCAGAPFREKWWMKADKPWRFLAAAFEWEAYCENGPQFSSHLPIIVDGTCNGFQHLSALLRNTKAATATNLMPGTRPADFYQEVADMLEQILKAEGGKWKPQADDWLENTTIDRKLVKPAVMATPYGIGLKKIAVGLLEKDFANDLKTPDASCKYLARRLKTCIRKKFEEAHATSTWLQQIAESFAKVTPSNVPHGVHWTAPTGFRVIQEKWEGKIRRLKTSCGVLVRYDQTKPISLPVKEQKKGIVPNFIHSLDAAHLMLTVKRMHDEGLRHFAVIHDGYAVHACDVEHLQKALREEFVGMYRKPVLKSFFLEQQFAAGAENLPEPPPIGDFDIEQVLESEYFFC